VFEALASRRRRNILAYLRDKPRHAGVIADRFEISKPAMSKHLSILEGAGLIWKKREGQFVIYGMEQENLAGHLWTYMQDICPPSNAIRAAARQEEDGDPPMDTDASDVR
jgi:DNA-binding transcriptional ArsR family regulator